ncbi:AraC family transcriptional regulator [Streptomyces chlorus]
MATRAGLLTRTPLRRFSVMEDAELEALEASAPAWLTECKFKTPRRQLAAITRASLSATTLGPVKLVYAHTVGSELAVDFTRQESNYVVSFALAGTNQVTVANEQALCSATRAVVLSPQMVAGMHLSDGYAQVHVGIERFALDRNLERMLDRPVTKPIRFQIGMDLTRPALASWVRGVKVLLEDLDEASGLSAVGAEANPWPDFLMTGLLLAQPNNYSEWLNQGQVNGFRPQSLKRAVELIEQEPAGDLSLSRLCSVAGVSARALQRHFREYVGLSPREYVQRVRLEHAHNDLAAGAGKTVAEIAYRSGFTHVPRFAGAYRERYGVPPLVTLRESATR